MENDYMRDFMKINYPELTHYVVGGAILLAIWVPLMNFFHGNITSTGLAWILSYIVVDQILHVVIKKEHINVVEGIKSINSWKFR